MYFLVQYFLFKEFYLGRSDNFLHVTYTTEFPRSGLHSRVIGRTLSPYSPDERGTSIH
jgi:hypothetical protein